MAFPALTAVTTPEPDTVTAEPAVTDHVTLGGVDPSDMVTVAESCSVLPPTVISSVLGDTSTLVTVGAGGGSAASTRTAQAAV